MPAGVYLRMNGSPENTHHLLALVRAKAEACTQKASAAAAAGEEWRRQASEWKEFATELQEHDELAPLVPVPPRLRF